MAKDKKPWIFTRGRRESIKKARDLHATYVRLGKKAYERGAR